MNEPTITLPRLTDESPKAYAARVAYCALGPARSLDKLRQSYGKTTAYTRQLEVWSARYRWVAHAQRWDATAATLATQQYMERYQREIEEHRERYQRVGKALYGVAVQMLADLERARVQMEYTPAALGVIARALLVAADLEAHALRVEALLGQLDTHSEG